MVELEFLGVSDGRLVFTDPDGQRYLISSSPEIVAALRSLTHLRPTSQPKQKLGLMEIQTRLRAGETVAALAAASDMSESAIETFAYPIIAERQYAAQQAIAAAIGEGGPALGDLVVDRLAARGIDPTTIEWDATRTNNDPWQLHLTFIQDAQVREANWSFADGHVTAIDEEARWLSETIAPSGQPKLHQLHEHRLDSPEEVAAPLDRPGAGTEALLESLQKARGKRQGVQLDDFDSELEEYAQAIATAPGTEGESISSVATGAATPTRGKLYAISNTGTAAETTQSRRSDITTPSEDSTENVTDAIAEVDAKTIAEVAATNHPNAQETIDLPGMEAPTPAPRKRPESRRRSVPSWDEIVFGPREPEN